MKLVRWKALIPFGLLLVVLVAGWILFIDAVVRRGVERVGATLVGARVDLAGAHVRLGSGSVVLTGLQVTDPAAPMRNLFEARELVAALDVLPLLEKKIVIDSLAVRGVRFGTARTESGALPAQQAGALAPVAHRVSDWAKQITLPSFSLEGLSQVINIPALSIDSLRTVTAARALVGEADSARRAWEADLRALDPRPQIDSAQALAERLKSVDVRTLGAPGARDLLASARSTADGLNRTITQARALEARVQTGVRGFETAATTGLGEARAQDYAWARGLVKLPSLDAPDISPALFGEIGLERIKGLLYWLSVAEQYVPPGLDPRRQVGPRRARAPGITVDFPRARAWPRFLLRYADAEFSLAGDNLAAGEYRAQVSGLTSQPALYGRPTQALAQRAGGRTGPDAVRAMAVLDHTRLPIKDSLGAVLSGLPLPTVPLPPLGARVVLGRGVTSVSLVRVGDVLEARWFVRATQPVWEQVGKGETGKGKGADYAQALLWRTVSGIKTVDIDTRVRGTLARPVFSVQSNVGGEIARSLREQVGAEVAKAERQVRAKVDSVVEVQVAAAREKVDAVKAQVQEKVEAERAELEEAKADLEQKIKDATPKLPGGIRLPGRGG